MDNQAMVIRPELLEGYSGQEDLLGSKGILKQLTKALVERSLNAEGDKLNKVEVIFISKDYFILLQLT
jgi:hypothetical protein